MAECSNSDNSTGSLRRLKDEARPFEWKEVDEKIDVWFTEAGKRFPEDFKKHVGNWDALREPSKRDARAALNPLEEAWKASVNLTVSKLEASVAPRFNGQSNRKVTLSWGYYDKTITPIERVKLTVGDTRISTSMGLGTGFTYEALDFRAPDPKLQVGVNDPALSE